MGGPTQKQRGRHMREREREDSVKGPEDVWAEEPSSLLAKGESAELRKAADSRKEEGV